MAIATTVGELAVEIPNATREFEKLGIDYCCGGSRTLGEACAEAKISVDEALDRLQKSMTAAAPSTGQDWQNQPLADLIGHITSTHHVFVREEGGQRYREFRRTNSVAFVSVCVHLRNKHGKGASRDRWLNCDCDWPLPTEVKTICEGYFMRLIDSRNVRKCIICQRNERPIGNTRVAARGRQRVAADPSVHIRDPARKKYRIASGLCGS